MQPNAEISLLNSLAEGLFFSILSVGGGGGGGGGGMSKEDKVSEVQVKILEQLRDDFVMLEIRMRIKEKGSPFVVFVLQELERMNKILSAIRTQLNELALGLSGALNISDSMDALINSIFMNQARRGVGSVGGRSRSPHVRGRMREAGLMALFGSAYGWALV